MLSPVASFTHVIVRIFLLLLLLGSRSCPAKAWSIFGRKINGIELKASASLSIMPTEVLNGIGSAYQDIDPNIIEDSFSKTPGLIEKYGYTAETHHVTTEDCYILELHRIPKANATPVLLVHGLLDSSGTWVMMGPNKGFAYMLADLGYDVWMANVRGNTYSRNHTTLNPKKAKYWEFSFHEMGKYDLPATIDYVLNVTGMEKLHYIGHSQGTVCFWIMCSERPEYNEKIISMQAMAPVAFLKKCKSPLVKFLAFFQEPISILLKLIGANEFLPSNEFLTLIGQIVCKDQSITQEICMNIVFLLTGFDKAQMNETMLPVVFGHTPAGASTKQMLHFGQLKKSGYFRQFDYGYVKNYLRYGRLSPPDYTLSDVTAKVGLHYATNDWLSSPRDVESLHQALPNVIGKFLVNYECFNHVDFVWGIDARKLIYRRVVKLMDLVEREEL